MLETDIIDGEGLAESGMGYARGYVVWHGIVEDIFDPRKLGRVRVRIIGWHSLDRGKMPTNTLPWAQVVKGTAVWGQSSNLQLNDWVTGYFLDGFDGQRPVVLGKYDGITREREQDFSRTLPPNEREKSPLGISGSLSGTGLDLPGGYAVDLTDEQKKMLRSYPKPDLNIVLKPAGKPSVPPLSQGIVNNTPVGEANKNRVHVCDISVAMKRAAAFTRAALGMLMKGIRAAIKAILGVLGISLDSESARFIELAKKIKREIDYVRRFIDKINSYTTIVVNYARQIRAMIDWILSLPKILAEMLAGCLNELLNAAAAGFSSLIASAAGVEGNPLKEVTEIIDSSQKLIDSTSKLLNVPGQVVEALATPSTAESQNAALNTVLKFTSSFSTSNNSTSNIQRP